MRCSRMHCVGGSGSGGHRHRRISAFSIHSFFGRQRSRVSDAALSLTVESVTRQRQIDAPDKAKARKQHVGMITLWMLRWSRAAIMRSGVEWSGMAWRRDPNKHYCSVQSWFGSDEDIRYVLYWTRSLLYTRSRITLQHENVQTRVPREDGDQICRTQCWHQLEKGSLQIEVLQFLFS